VESKSHCTNPYGVISAHPDVGETAIEGKVPKFPQFSLTPKATSPNLLRGCVNDASEEEMLAQLHAVMEMARSAPASPKP
jgi:hypothetical protein